MSQDHHIAASNIAIPRKCLGLSLALRSDQIRSRRFSIGSAVLQDFVSAVMDVDYSPTGREFVAGGYDRSVRIFPYNGGHSREVYHTKRMQRVFATRFSGDATYVFSGSDDMNVRVWKVRHSRQNLSFMLILYYEP